MTQKFTPREAMTASDAVEHSDEEQWYCPTSNSIECHHAGFDACCDAPERHVALSFDLVEKAVVAYHAPHPRPLVDREALAIALHDDACPDRTCSPVAMVEYYAKADELIRILSLLPAEAQPAERSSSTS